MGQGAVIPLESAIVERINKWLDVQPGVWTLKVKGGSQQKRGVPDILGVVHGRAFALEVKRPGGEVSESQRYQLQKLANAGALVAVVESLEDVRELLHIS